ncbi:MAG: hypothetical protein FWC66_01570 [Oscillospiraceae bacterium]|nr:hypothetical protein [Oscillospiraceae bacterium]
MANYDDFRKKAKNAFDTLADVSVEAYKLAEEKAKILAKKAKLNAGIANERATIRRLNVEIGATYYKLHKDNPEEALQTQCEDVTAAYERIAAKQRELEDLKSATASNPCECTGEECCTEDTQSETTQD